MTNILFVDDNQEVLFLAKELLTSGDPSFELTCINSAIEGLKKLSVQAFDVVISDYEMPDMNGLELLNRLRKEGNSVPFILLTGRGGEEVAMRALNSGADYYVVKGDNPEHLYVELAHITQGLIQQRQLEREKEEIEAQFRHLTQRYRLLLEKMPTGFALHEIILDQEGTPCDYCFLEVNPAFEELIGLKQTEIIGKNVTEVLSRSEEMQIDIYGVVAQMGKSIKSEIYFQDQNRSCEAIAFRPAPDQFAVIFNDITIRRRAEREIEREDERLGKLAQKLATRLQNNLLAIQERAVFLQTSYNPEFAKEINHRVKTMVELLNWEWTHEEKEK